MSWLDMRNLALGDLVDELDIDSIQQNAQYIQSPNAETKEYTGGIMTFANTSWVDMLDPELVISLRTYGGPLIAMCHLTYIHTAVNGGAYFSIEVDGADLGGTDGLYYHQVENNSSPHAAAIIGHKFGLSAGLHTVKMRVKSSGINLQVYASATYKIIFSALGF